MEADKERLDQAKSNLRRGRRIVKAQIKRVRDHERNGRDSGRARQLLVAMTETLCLMLGDYERLKREAAAQGLTVVASRFGS